MIHAEKKLILLGLLILSIFVLPTSEIITNFIIYIVNFNNFYFVTFVKVLLLLIIVYLYELYIYLTNTNIQKTLKFIEKLRTNPAKYLIIILLLFNFATIFILKFLELYTNLTISSDTWVSFIGTLIASTLTALGIIISVLTYLKDKHLRETPKLSFEFKESFSPGSSIFNIKNNVNQIVSLDASIQIQNKSNFAIRDIHLTYIIDPNFNSKDIHKLIDYLAPNEAKNINLNLCFEANDKDYDVKKISIIYFNENYEEFMTVFTIELDKQAKELTLHKIEEKRNYFSELAVG